MADLKVETVETTPIADQKTGTSGLRKKVTVFQSKNYIQNWLQSLFDWILTNSQGQLGTLVVGGDGRYWNKDAIHIILHMAVANGFRKFIVGQDGILSTPAVSHIIRKYSALGGIILTASHNPGGPNNDFGIKYNVSSGGPAPESVTSAIYDINQKLSSYKTSNLPAVDLGKCGEQVFFGGEVSVTVLDSCADYLEFMKEIFDWAALKALFARKDFKVCMDSLNGVTGPYSKRIFVDELGASADSVCNAEPKEDFGGLHPDPNLTYAADLVAKMNTGQYDFGAAWDGDGDRNMVLGKKFFVNPSDSLAIICAHATCVPYFKDGVKCVSRSMPTSEAVDYVARKFKYAFYEVPTGWKFFSNIMDHYEADGGHAVICGEESFGNGSDHIREKDGIWATLMWLSILAAQNRDTPEGSLRSVEAITRDHWKEYGRNYYTRYDYEEVSKEGADSMMAHLRAQADDASLIGKEFGAFKVAKVDDFEYNDVFEKSVTKKQGVRVIFSDGSRFVFRLSGTGSSGATVRLYLERYEKDSAKLDEDPQAVMAPLIAIALEVSKLDEFTGRKAPTVIT
mmetsp:Transcript_49302/g.123966  ORF Transcript_49302/g.123966 Transcript_49302/m.123966 type:complete len:567 (+) Transcript_49302:63-1763(+)